MVAPIDMTGQRYGRLIGVRRVGKNKFGRAVWLLSCDCGGTIESDGNNVRFGNVRSCGCAARERATALSKQRVIHGMCGTPTYRSWVAMKERCQRPSHHKFSLYGGRGITVCAQWQTFSNFLADMGERPEGTTIDRIDVNAGYRPGNCRWASVIEQRANRRDSRRAA